MLKAIGNIIGTALGIMLGVILFAFGLVIFGLILKVMWNFFMLGWRIL
jgi:hypothetical protein